MEKGITILALKKISKYYRSGRSLFSNSEKKVTALKDVSLNIRQGEIFGLVGASGSGKTTIGRLVVKLEEPDNGHIEFNQSALAGLKGKALKAFRKDMQMICQDPYQSLNPYFSVYDTIQEPLIIHKMGNKKKRYDKVLQVLENVGLTPPGEYIHRYPHQMSGGQRQRVAIARAGILKPKFIVADEPTSMLDAPVAMQFYSILSHLKIKRGVTFLFITHNIAAARLLCDRIAVIHHGRIVEQGPCKKIIKNPKSDYTKALIRAQPGYSAKDLSD